LAKDDGEADFRKAYSAAVNQAISMLGKNSSKIVRAFLERQSSTRLEDTVDDPKRLADTLENSIDGASKVVERQIVRLLYESIDSEPPFVMTTDFALMITELKGAYKRRAQERTKRTSKRR
jgi:predicted ArsR family transcriptional regulator